MSASTTIPVVATVTGITELPKEVHQHTGAVGVGSGDIYIKILCARTPLSYMYLGMYSVTGAKSGNAANYCRC